MQPTMTHIALQVQNLDASLHFYRTYCGMQIVHRRGGEAEHSPVVWIAEPGRGDSMVFVLIPGQPSPPQKSTDYGHLGFALDSSEAVDRIAQKAKGEDLLVWPPKQEPFPVGYYCGVRDPDGRLVEFSYGQPLGPGAAAS